MTKYTEGPWQILPEEVGKDYIRIRGTALGGRYKIANVITPVFPGVPDREVEETRANARLIAAAPETAAERDRLKVINAELLEALERLILICAAYNGLEAKKAHAVVKKAKGAPCQ